MARASRAPWKRANPRKRAGKKSKHLTSAQKSTAKARARRAGRPYPNLVDNMRMASKASKKKAAKKRPAKKTAGKRAAKTTAKKTAKKASKKKAPKKAAATRPARAREKDPKGGLTAAGRSAFARRDGSHLKPGVTKALSDMTPQDMRRKGSWAVRFTAVSNFLRWLMAGEGRRGTRCQRMPGASLFPERSRPRDASPPRANGCCSAIGGSSKRPDGCKPNQDCNAVLSNPCKSWFAARALRRLPRLHWAAASNRHTAPWRPIGPGRHSAGRG